MARREFARSVKRRDLRLLRQERAKKERQLAQDFLAQTTRVMRLQVKLLVTEKLLVATADPLSLWLRQASSRPPLLEP